MIVNYTTQGWEIITQRAHGLLAAQLAWHWKFNYPGNRSLETLLAIAEHDDTGIEFDPAHLLTPAGGPVHYAMRGFDPVHCRELMIASQAKSMYFALLNAMHLQFLFGKEKSAAAKTLMKEIRRYITASRRTLKLAAGEADRVYTLMQWCDALSLILCQHAIQPEYRMTEISKGPGGTSYRLCQLSPNILSVHPWPFTEHRFTITVESRTVNQLQFAKPSDLLHALEQAPVKQNPYTFDKKAFRTSRS